MHALLLALWLFQSQANDPLNHGFRTWPPLMIVAPVAATNTDFIDRPVEVCGHIVAIYPERNEAMMVGGQKALMVDVRGRADLVVRRAACVTGVIRRRDGLTERERRERNMPLEYISHGPTPGIVLYQCHDQASCERLMQPGRVRPEQLDTRHGGGEAREE